MKFLDVYGAIGKARRQASGQDGVAESDVTDAGRLTDILRRVVRRVGALEALAQPEATEFEVNVTSGTDVRLYHGFGCPVRYSVVYWKQTSGSSSSSGTQPSNMQWSLAHRAMHNGNLASVAGAFTYGCRYRMKTVTPIVGVRFDWISAAGARTVRVAVWNDSTGALLTSKDISVPANTGVNEAIFDSPLTTDLTGVDILVTVSEQAGAVGVYSTSSTYVANIECGRHFTMKSALLYANSINTRPTLVTGGGHYPVEPILAEPGATTSSSNLFTVSSLTNDQLVLTPSATGRAIIRVEPSQYGISP